MEKDTVKNNLVNALLSKGYITKYLGQKLLNDITDIMYEQCNVNVEQLKKEGREEATEDIRKWLIGMDYEGLAESL